MKLEDQVCSLEFSKRLKELGVKQESLFYYQNQPFNDGTNDISICIKEIISAHNDNSIMNTYSMDEFDEPIYSAFTVAELGELLPKEFHDKEWDELLHLVFFKSLNKTWIASTHYKGGKGIYHHEEKKETDVRAKMLINLLENKLMELPNET